MPQPYKIIETGENTFSFTTSDNLEYDCIFRDMLPYLDSPLLGIYDINVMDFEFHPYDPTPGKRKSKDENISHTIKQILSNFFLNPLNILTYVCDSSDSRHRERSYLFNKWYKECGADFYIIPLEIHSEENEVTTYGCVICNNAFPYPEILQSHLIDKAKIIMNEKNGG